MRGKCKCEVKTGRHRAPMMCLMQCAQQSHVKYLRVHSNSIVFTLCASQQRHPTAGQREREREKKQNKTNQTKKNQTNTNKPPSATKKHLLYKASVRDQAAVQLWFVESQPVLLILMNAAPFNSNAVLVTLCMNYIYPLKLVYFAQAVTLPSFLDWHLLQVWVDKENMLAYWINKQNLAPSSEVFISERLFSGRQTDGRGTAATLSDSVEHV